MAYRPCVSRFICGDPEHEVADRGRRRIERHLASAMTLAAIDRLVHHATILEMNLESYRRKAPLKRKRVSAD